MLEVTNDKVDDERRCLGIPENMISYLSSLVERGVTVNVLSELEDILQSSIDYYRRRKDFSCQDWTDNLDSIDFCGVSQLEQ